VIKIRMEKVKVDFCELGTRGKLGLKKRNLDRDAVI